MTYIQYYNVEFWKNAMGPQKRACDKNKHEHAETSEEAEAQGRVEFGNLPSPAQHERDRVLYPIPWACRVTTSGAPPAPPPKPQPAPAAEEVSGAQRVPGAAGAAESTAVADAPAAAAVDAASGPLVTDDQQLKREHLSRSNKRK